MRRLVWCFFAGLLLPGCFDNSEADKLPYKDLTVALTPPEYGFQITSTPFVVEPGAEVEMCDVVFVKPATDGETLVWFKGFESLVSHGSHHMNVLAGRFSVAEIIGEGVAERLLGVKAGQYKCADLGDLMADQGAQVFYPSQREHQAGQFPQGVGYPGIVPLLLIMSHHYINLGDEPVLVNAAVNLHRMSEIEVEHIAGLVWAEDGELLAPAGGRSLEGGTCVLEQDTNLVAMSSHTHQAAECLTINLYDGATSSVAESPFFVNHDWQSPPILFLDQNEATGGEILPLNKGDGFSFTCHYYNRTDTDVVYGPSARDEMCIAVALAYPANISVAEVRDLVENPTIDGFDRFNKGTRIPCTFTDAVGAYEPLGKSLPAGDAGHCGELPSAATDQP